MSNDSFSERMIQLIYLNWLQVDNENLLLKAKGIRSILIFILELVKDMMAKLCIHLFQVS